MTTKSFLRSIMYPSGHARARREQRQRFLEAVNHFCQDNKADVILRKFRGKTTAQPQVQEDELSDYMHVSIELVSSLNYCAFVFGHERLNFNGSLIGRLWDYKKSTGTIYPESRHAIEPLYWQVAEDWHGGSLSLSVASSPRPLSTFELFDKISAAVSSMSHWQNNLSLAEKDKFFLTEEHKSHFTSIFVWGAMIHELEPRLTDQEIENRWGNFGSPSAKRRIIQTKEQEYDDDIQVRAGIWALEQQRENSREDEWLEAKNFEENEVRERQDRILRNSGEAPESDN